jgi:hypothetical protein
LPAYENHLQTEGLSAYFICGDILRLSMVQWLSINPAARQ